LYDGSISFLVFYPKNLILNPFFRLYLPDIWFPAKEDCLEHSHFNRSFILEYICNILRHHVFGHIYFAITCTGIFELTEIIIVAEEKAENFVGFFSKLKI